MEGSRRGRMRREISEILPVSSISPLLPSLPPPPNNAINRGERKGSQKGKDKSGGETVERGEGGREGGRGRTRATIPRQRRRRANLTSPPSSSFFRESKSTNRGVGLSGVGEGAACRVEKEKEVGGGLVCD